MTDYGAPREDLSRRFAHFAAELSSHHSPLYSRLAEGISEDPELLGLVSHAASGPEPNLFLSAAHFLLLGGADHPVAGFYPSLSNNLRSGDPYPDFRAFCLEHAKEMREIIATRRVQTNEVRRCALLLPAFGVISERSGQPLALVEVGASAGLNLLFDRYAYDYGEERGIGAPASPVRISCEPRGDKEVPLPERLPEVVSRIGLDLNPLDVRDPDSARWLRALIWPEEYAHRAPLLERAIEVARSEPPALLRGDALESLPEVFGEIPDGTSVCVFHTFTVNQFSEEARKRLSNLLSEHSRKRELCRVSVEWLGADDSPLLKLSTFENGVEEETLLARCDDHGEWIEWIA